MNTLNEKLMIEILSESELNRASKTNLLQQLSNSEKYKFSHQTLSCKGRITRALERFTIAV